jgi:hypothetical protein
MHPRIFGRAMQPGFLPLPVSTTIRAAAMFTIRWSAAAMRRSSRHDA